MKKIVTMKKDCDNEKIVIMKKNCDKKEKIKILTLHRQVKWGTRQ